MAYVYFMPPAPVTQPEVERPAICSPQRTGVWGPLLIFVGGASALMIGFFEREPAIIWPIICVGAVMCGAGVYLARRNVKFWRDQEQERQRAMWRPPNFAPQANRDGRAAGGGNAQPSPFDVPMYCLEAPSRPLIRPSLERQAGKRGQSGDGPRPTYGNPLYGDEFWFTLAVPLRPDTVTEGHYLEWAALTLVVQPHFKFVSCGNGDAATAIGSMGAQEAFPGGNGTGTKGGGCDVGGAVLTRTGGGSSRRLAAADSPADGSNGGTLNAVSLTLVRTPSLGLRTANGSTYGATMTAPAERRTGRSSLPGRMGDLLSLFTSVAGGGGATAASDGIANGAGATDCEAAGGGGDGGLEKPPWPVAPAPAMAVTAADASPEGYTVEGVPVFPAAKDPGPSNRPSGSQASHGPLSTSLGALARGSGGSSSTRRTSGAGTSSAAFSRSNSGRARGGAEAEARGICELELSGVPRRSIHADEG